MNAVSKNFLTSVSKKEKEWDIVKERESTYTDTGRHVCWWGARDENIKKWCIVNKRENTYSDRETDVGTWSQKSWLQWVKR